MVVRSAASASPASTSMCQGWRLPPEAARAARVSTRRMVSPSTGVGRKARMDWRLYASWICMGLGSKWVGRV
jgi:hypothetical protein